MSPRNMSRREFLKFTGLTLDAAAVACSGLGYAATRSPRTADPKIKFEKDPAVNKRVLIA
ncbi:hypothetical protein BECAL_03012 [Bellilinea caldifistulae]|uniref:twin-arginine translocation signal domain-containing protein n=1 Tax=Bellilinea caldifistulae TaxID=360411 RepID=UPI00191C80BF|nr:twin-arginine translocation signal domain-containing protein [Bellilinea caldifistulae]GAP11818.1 hypothetical protein BECAL_03012 [Bellilinea caldifistulae]